MLEKVEGLEENTDGKHEAISGCLHQAHPSEIAEL